MHAFVDESARQSYLLCAALVEGSVAEDVRRRLRSLRVAGQRRVHMRSEGDGRRREILSAVSGLDVKLVICRTAFGGRPMRAAHDDCFRSLLPILIDAGLDRLVVESCDQDIQDRRVIREMLDKAGSTDRVTYLHSAPTEPLLWIADIVAWAYGRGGDWRRRISALAIDVVEVDL